MGKGKNVINRELETETGIDLTIQVYSPPEASLAGELPNDPDLYIIDPKVGNLTQVPAIASRSLLEQADAYDLVGYMEDDLIIGDTEFFAKIQYLNRCSDGSHTFIPHRCEHIPGKGDVILSGDPDGGRPDLFWDTGEQIEIPWLLGEKRFYRATNPHSGCYFLTKRQAITVRNYWAERRWSPSFQLSGPSNRQEGIYPH